MNAEAKKVAVVFGGHRASEAQIEYQQAMRLGRVLASRGVTLRTGGYGGIMGAVAQGAQLAGGSCEGVGLEGWKSEARCPFIAPRDFREASFFHRLPEMARGADLFIFLSGGVGTLCELSTLWTAKIMRIIPEDSRLVLLGRSWPRLLEGIGEHLAVGQRQLGLLEVFDDVDEFLTSGSAHDDGSCRGPLTNPSVRIWNRRAGTWNDEVTHSGHFSQADDGYHRFDAFLASVLSRRFESLEGARLLDLGAGTGSASQSLLESVPQVGQGRLEALDFSPAMADQAAARRIFSEIHISDLGASEPLPAPYQVIFSRGVLLSRFAIETLPAIFRKVHSSLAPGGLFLFDFLNDILDESVAAPGKTRLALPGLRTLLTENGFRLTDVEGLAYRTINVGAVAEP